MRFNILFGGKAGQGPNILSDLVSKGLVSKGYYVFYSRDYQSVIRGGHNFNLVSFSDEPIMSNHNAVDIMVALDENTETLHAESLKKEAIVLKGEHPNMYFAGALFKILGMDYAVLKELLRELRVRFDENLKESEKGYSEEERKLKLSAVSERDIRFMNGSQAISKAAIASGLDIYYAYPMTPATPVLTELAQEQLKEENKHLVIQPENEIAVINAAIGSSVAGAKSMVGTSGGGFDLMTEALSLAGMAAVPVVIYLAQRPGPSTGVPTYTGQGDLNAARHAGHGEFSRVVIAPGDPKEAATAVSEAFYFSQKFRIPVILLGDKHLAESKYSFEGAPDIMKSEKSITKPERFSSYESGKGVIATEDPILIKKATEARLKKQQAINSEAEKFETHKIYGNKNSRNLVIGWGSTKGAILDATKNLDCKYIHIIYIEPFSKKLQTEISKAENIIVIENNVTSPLSDLIAEKTDRIVQDDLKILRYDARPFTNDEIRNKLKVMLK